MLKFIIFAILTISTIDSDADTLFSTGFEQRPVEKQFPMINGVFQLPDYAVTSQLDWLMQQFSLNDTSIADVNNHFDLIAFGLTAQQMRDFIQIVRTSFPNAIITDVIMVTPVSLTILIADPNDMSKYGFFNLRAEFSGLNRIRQFSVSNYFGSVQIVDDRNLTMEQALDKFQTFTTQSSILVAEIDDNGICQPISERNSSQLRATASIFKIWILTAAAEAWQLGQIELDQIIKLVSSELALGGTINNEPLGTEFTLLEIATLMLGISDNTATDLLHETIGRDLIHQVITDLGIIDADALIPLLGINEQFHLFFSFPLATALNYVNGSEAFQADFLVNQIEPLGPLTSFPFNNDSIFIEGSWRASPMDICQTFAHLRDLPEGSDALKLANIALGAAAAQPEVRNFWDRVWYKGGSLESGINGLQVLTHAWLLENQGENAYVVIAMANNPNGGIDVFPIQSITGRILELVRGF